MRGGEGMKLNKGFTLMELMIAIAIIMILAGAIVARLGSGTEKAKIGKATGELQEIVTASRSFFGDTGVWPEDTKSLVNSATTTGYNEYGESGKSFEEGGVWRGPYLETKVPGEVPNDPWKQSYTIVPTGDNAINAHSNGPPKGQPIDILIHRFSS